MTDVFVELLQAVLGGLGAGALLLGLALFVAPRWVWRFWDALDRWGSPGALIHWLNAPRAAERLLYRHHRPFGAVLVIASVYGLYAQTFRFNVHQAAPLLTEHLPAGLDGAVALAAALFLFFGTLFAFAVGVVVYLRPSLLKGLEGWANRWVGFDGLRRLLVRPYWETDRWLRRRPRTTGTVLVLAGLYILLSTVSLGGISG